MRQLNRFKSIKALMVLMAMPLLMFLGMGDVMAEGYMNKTQKLTENMAVGPQLSEAELKTLKAQKITQVINFRTVGEMEALSYDEAAILKAQGIAYHSIPMGKSLGYTSAQLTQFNEVMEKHGTENTVLHCRSGYRANLIYAAWLMKYQGLDKAVAKKIVHAWSDDAIDQLLAE